MACCEPVLVTYCKEICICDAIKVIQSKLFGKLFRARFIQMKNKIEKFFI